MNIDPPYAALELRHMMHIMHMSMQEKLTTACYQPCTMQLVPIERNAYGHFPGTRAVQYKYAPR